MSIAYLRFHLEKDMRGGGLCKGSNSKSATTTTTNTTDKRMVVDGGSMGVTADGSTINVTTLDSGIVQAALDTVKAADATNGEGFEGLLSLADKLFDKGGELVASSQNTALAQIEAINAASADKAGTIDQKTMIVLAVAGAAALVLAKGN